MGPAKHAKRSGLCATASWNNERSFDFTQDDTLRGRLTPRGLRGGEDTNGASSTCGGLRRSQVQLGNEKTKSGCMKPAELTGLAGLFRGMMRGPSTPLRSAQDDILI
jgi:hypothetical protein